MKNILTGVILFSTLPLIQPERKGLILPISNKKKMTEGKTENLFVITLDGFRWQEVFNGADTSLINDVESTADTATMKMLYWANSENERRQKLMPFFWNVLAKKGQLYGNRHYNSRVNTSNLYTFSYPGYSEIFTGTTDLFISSNKKKRNPNINVLEYLNSLDGFRNKVVAFTSWDVFPYILNEERSGMLINSGYEPIKSLPESENQKLTNKVQEEAIYDRGGSRKDELTFITAKEYARKYKPKVLFLGLGETDEYAHAGRYDLYLEHANKVDRMIAELWHWVQSTPGYANNTSFLITTDHGRGKQAKKWTSHSSFISGSSQTWLALMGPGLTPIGEVKEDQQLYQRQIAQMIAALLGEEFGKDEMVSTR